MIQPDTRHNHLILAGVPEGVNEWPYWMVSGIVPLPVRCFFFIHLALMYGPEK
jgi:hypothetical protein